MASKELFSQVEQIIWRDRARVIPSRSTDLANEILNAILVALQYPTDEMLKAGWGGLGDEVWNPTTIELTLSFKGMLNASPLGEQSE